jgi:magnesium-transporting ATPase (P-type)
MAGLPLRSKTGRSLFIAIGFLCIALVALMGIVQIAHTHAQLGQTDCAVCHTAHLVIQPAVPQSLPHTVRVEATLAVTPQPIRRQHLSVFSLFTRPPPDQTAVA